MPLPLDLPPWAVGLYPAGPDAWSGLTRRDAAAVVALSAAGWTPDEVVLAEHSNEWLARVQEWVEYLRAEQGLGVFGDGNDGAATISINTTLTRVMYYTDLTVDSGAIIDTAGYPIFCTGTLTLDSGIIDWSGNAGADSDGVGGGGAGGAALAATVLGGSAAGGAGGNTGANGTAGSNSARVVAAGNGGRGADPAMGGASGGLGGGGTLAIGDTRSVRAALSGQALSVTSTGFLDGGAGGGGGGGDVDGGGGGGSGGGIVLVSSRVITIINAGAILGDGGDGGLATAGTNDGGGGGGGQGGTVYIISREYDPSGGTVTAAGGAGGVGGGGNGDPGNDGAVVLLS